MKRTKLTASELAALPEAVCGDCPKSFSLPNDEETGAVGYLTCAREIAGTVATCPRCLRATK